MSERQLPQTILNAALVASLGASAWAAEPGVALAAKPLPLAATIGYDVSYPQCNPDHLDQRTTLPTKRSLGIVGLNGTLGNTFNPCAAAENKWAQHSSGVTAFPKSSFYVHVGNPGNQVADWPQTGKNPYGVCDGRDTRACAYQYGEQLAVGDERQLKKLGVAATKVWIDVETNYSWQTGSPKGKQRDTAVMEGMTRSLETTGYEVGIYSSTTSWKAIVGKTKPGSDLHGLSNWLLGATTHAEAEANCELPSFTGGPVVLTQVAGGRLDQDIPCPAAK